MSKFKKAIVIKKEIDKLNDKIDMKIIKGLSYREESRRHKFLVRQHAVLYRSSWPSFGTTSVRPRKSSFLTRSMRVVSTFLF